MHTICEVVLNFPARDAGMIRPSEGASARKPVDQKFAADDQHDHPGRHINFQEFCTNATNAEKLKFIGERIEENPERGDFIAFPSEFDVIPIG